MTDHHILDRLHTIIMARKGKTPEDSYTARLYDEGTAKIAQKVGEEAVETIIEAMKNDKARMAEESADLLYHLLVLWADRDLNPNDVWDILDKRFGGNKS